MKAIFIIALFFGMCCRAQTYSLADNGYGYQQTQGVYYKDTYNDFDNLVGTWKFENGNIAFTLVLQKLTMYYDASDQTYIDIVIGEYRYVDENGNELINTLSNINNGNPYNNNVSGLLLYPATSREGSKIIKLDFTDPQRNYLNRFILIEYFPAESNSLPRIKIKFRGDSSILPNENSPTELRVPEQDYILIKVP